MSLPFRTLCLTPLLLVPFASPVVAAAEENTALPIDEVRLFAEIFGGIKNYYVDDVSDKKLIENAIKGMVSGLDPHSSFLDEKGYKDLQESTSGEFGGLGIEVTKDPQGVRVVTPIDDTPAARAGVLAGDIIIKIDGKVSADQSLDENVKMMRGKPGTSITLTIARKGAHKPVVITLVRDIIKIRSVKSKALSDHIGYIRITQFQGKTTGDFSRALGDLLKDTKLKGIVLDLRNNPGGLLNAAIGVSAAFISEGLPVVSTKGRIKSSDRIFKATYKDYVVGKEGDELKGLPSKAKTIPVVVLVNSASASASEIVSGALQDHKRATIMGTRSFGKGSVQTIIPLRMKNRETLGIKMTTARYYTPSGRSIQATGIVPDIAVDDTPEGNYPSFAIREADLSGHIEAEKAEKKNPVKEREDEEETEGTVPTLRYTFGDEKDFPLKQAVNHLLGNPVITHADIQRTKKEAAAAKKAKAEKEGKSKEKKTDSKKPAK